MQTGEVSFHIGPFAIHDAALIQSVYMAFRVFVLMLAGVMFSLVTSPISITDGLERMLSPFERLGMPVHELAMMYTIAIRFVPILVPLFASALRHAEELANAMEARCYVGGEGRTHYHILKVRGVDVAAIAVFVAYIASLVLIGVLV